MKIEIITVGDVNPKAVEQITEIVNEFVPEPRTIWAIQGNYGCGWEDVTYEDTKPEALQMLNDYRTNEPQYAHRIKRTTI